MAEGRTVSVTTADYERMLLIPEWTFLFVSFGT
jgi:hypothetical protein